MSITSRTAVSSCTVPCWWAASQPTGSQLHVQREALMERELLALPWAEAACQHHRREHRWLLSLWTRPLGVFE
eukprot:1775262-Rhodomonas_salina.2